MCLPENVEHLFVACLTAVEYNVHYLGVSSRAGAYGTVGGILCVSTGVTDTCRVDTFGFPKLAFSTPETVSQEKKNSQIPLSMSLLISCNSIVMISAQEARQQREFKIDTVSRLAVVCVCGK